MVTGKSKLQIKLLSASGELLNCINCFAGQVSVLRATTNSELLPYLRAISGSTGPERFVVELNGEPFRSNEHNIIGFGERFSGGDGTVEEFFIAAGAPASSMSSLLMSYGLENKLSANCSQLTRCEERRLRLLAAVYNPEKILICNDPFDPISSEWRERFAELLLQFARSKRQIVVVPALSYRPECWIDNDLVARIQVGQNIQKTVGFGSQATDVQALVSEMRAQFQSKSIHETPKEEDSSRVLDKNVVIKSAHATEISAEESGDTPVFKPKLVNFVRHRRLLIIPLLLALPAALWLIASTSKPEIAVVQVEPIKPRPVVLPAEQPAISQEKSPNVAKVEEKTQQPAVVNPEMQTAMLIASYPQPIQKAIIESVQSRQGKSVSSGLSVPNSEAQTQMSSQSAKSKEAGDFLKLLQYAGKEEDNATVQQEAENESEPAAEPDPVDEQERREQIRRKFLEAIQRAQERRAQE